MVRVKNRYIVIQINEIGKGETSQLKLKEWCLQESIINMVERLHGDFGVAAIRQGFRTKYCNEHTRVAIIRARRGPHKLVASALPCIKVLGFKSISINTLYIGATIKHCFGFVKNYQQRKFDEYCAMLRTDDEKIALRNEMLNYKSLNSESM